VFFKKFFAFFLGNYLWGAVAELAPLVPSTLAV
jgi:hypothetical protein